MSGLKPIGGVIVELGRYLAVSPHSRIRRWQALRELDDRVLADVGLSRSDVEMSRSTHNEHRHAAEAQA